MKNLKINEDVHRILTAARDELEKRGIENPNHQSQRHPAKAAESILPIDA